MNMTIAHSSSGRLDRQRKSFEWWRSLIPSKLEKRREQNRNRSRNYRARQQNHADGHDDADAVSLLPSTATTSYSVKEERSEIVALGREFAETFYPIYPHHVGRPKAEIAFRKARKRASLEMIMAGLERYRAKTDDRPWCNPATWLNQDRWDDKPGPTQEGNGHGRAGRPAPKDDPKASEGPSIATFRTTWNERTSSRVITPS